MTTKTIAFFEGSPSDEIICASHIVEEILSYDPYGRGSSEVVYRDPLGGEHRTSTRYIRLVTISKD